MMKKREYILWVVSFYLLTAALLLVGTFYDLQIDKALYNPENAFVLFLQKYGEVPRFALLARELFVRRFWKWVNKQQTKKDASYFVLRNTGRFVCRGKICAKFYCRAKS